MLRELVFPIVLQLVGVAVIIAELVLPSGGLLSLTAAGCIGYSLYHVFKFVSIKAGYVFVAADAVIIPVLIITGIKLLSRSPVTLRTVLSRDKGVGSQNDIFAHLVGKTGTVEMSLRPSGKARIDGKRLDVVSEGDYIDAGAGIIVTAVNGNRIVVKETAR